MLAYFWNNGLIVQAPELKSLALITDIFRIEAANNAFAVSRILGPVDQASLVRRGLGAERVPCVPPNPAMPLFSLELQNLALPPVLAAQGIICRRAVKADLATLADWYVSYGIEALGETPPATETERHARREEETSYCERAIENKDLFVIVQSGILKSVSIFTSRLDDLVQIGGVYTPPEFRNRGFGRMVVAGQLQMIATEGARQAILFAHEPAAIRAYRSIGFRECDTYATILFSQPLQF